MLINITGGYDLTLFELDEAANRIREEVDPDANIIVGSTLDPDMEGMMRVSVVATGIDAAPVTAEIPVPRRSLAEPLKPAEPEVKPVAAAPAPQPAPQPVVAAQPAAPAPQPVERNLFDAAPAPQHSEVADNLPPPAYQPRPAAPRDLHVEEDAAAFVAPRPRAPGTPSPEAMARLQAAVNKVPQQQAAQRPAMAASRPAAPQPQPQAEKPRFGINSLINRMTGHAAQPGQEMPQRQAVQPQQSAYEDEGDGEQDRIEIPAFLRRQAN